jgi:dimethylamine monooxygenase subunit A
MLHSAIHTPYDGSSPPFTIGLSGIPVAEWIECDAHLKRYLLEKDRLALEVPEKVFAAEPDTSAAQREVLELLAEHLPRQFPQAYRRDGDFLEVLPPFRRVDLRAYDEPLKIAARLVQEDLLIMRKGEAGWRLCAGSLSFPSSWRLLEKFGKTMPQIHAPVPAFGAGSRNMTLIQRMFDHLRDEHVFLRWNWGLYDGDALHQPGAGNGMRRFGADGNTSHLYIRVERQTLRRLPRTRDILFTIRTHLHPFSMLSTHPQRKALATEFARQLHGLSEVQLSYKGLFEERDRLLKTLYLLAT